MLSVSVLLRKEYPLPCCLNFQYIFQYYNIKNKNLTFLIINNTALCEMLTGFFNALDLNAKEFLQKENIHKAELIKNFCVTFYIVTLIFIF